MNSAPVTQPLAPDSALQLRDIHLPEPISWWPPAPGWWALLIVIIAGIIGYVLLRKIRNRQRDNRRLREQIAQELAAIRHDYQHQANNVILVRQLSELLRRAAISYYPARDIAGLTGDDWLGFLAHSHSREKPGLSFTSDDAKTLIIAPYLDDAANIELDGERLIALCESWLLQKHARLPAQVPRHISGSPENSDQALETGSRETYPQQVTSS